MRLLIVEDEPAILEQLTLALGQQGFAIDTACDGKEGLFLAQDIDYDLAIIDLGLPLLSGIELIQTLRSKGRSFPILILTARGNWEDKVEGLEAGADDYVVKPFQIEEVHARINALLRRSAGQSSPCLEFGPIAVNLSTKTVSLHNNSMELTPYEFNTLAYLIHKQPSVVSKTELTEHLYDQDFDRDSNVIEVFIGRLRKKLDPDNSLKPIATVRGQGYRWALPQVNR